jgi:hypothetical protein
MFFGFERGDNVTNILLQLRLPSFNTLLADGAFFTLSTDVCAQQYNFQAGDFVQCCHATE